MLQSCVRRPSSPGCPTPLCVLAFAALATASLAGCHSGASKPDAPSAAVVEAPPSLALPASVKPAPELAPLAFMTGRWVGINPNKTVNEEHWMAPRGNHMIAMFRQVRRDGKPAFVEVSLVSVEPDGITLRLRHLHGGLEVPPKQAEISVFKLKAAADNRAEFVGTGNAEQVTSVIYRLDGPDQLAVDVAFSPSSKEKGYTTTYTRDRVTP